VLEKYEDNAGVRATGIYGNGHLKQARMLNALKEHMDENGRQMADTLIKVMKALNQADLGFSAVVSGLLDDVDCCARQAGISRHSVDISLGIWGNLDKLPEKEIMEITTMCGHAMISANLVNKLVRDIRDGKTTAQKAALELTAPCVCGIFNTEKAVRLLGELAAKLLAEEAQTC
ncbi:MAG: hypothetical protein LBU86_01510, partial [Oscillospiraceae bacterium]|jgi:hypothetical protein|nr:hypothetical protein [Oscillospiraceae bacterium]